MNIGLLDVVQLKDGRSGTVVEVFSDAFMVEIADEDGVMQDLPIVKEQDVVRVIWRFGDKGDGPE